MTHDHTDGTIEGLALDMVKHYMRHPHIHMYTSAPGTPLHLPLNWTQVTGRPIAQMQSQTNRHAVSHANCVPALFRVRRALEVLCRN